jgi:hypothetical protein
VALRDAALTGSCTALAAAGRRGTSDTGRRAQSPIDRSRQAQQLREMQAAHVMYPFGLHLRTVRREDPSRLRHRDAERYRDRRSDIAVRRCLITRQSAAT